ncbi:Tif4631p [Rhizophagus irregularis DAOM 197198w]|uniref:Tif4631p n=1 Tax=Rhizophagus irregularis (strain DAOM 197198w) TaxID=1432141 RepID=A0A015MU97_RHIIW|nr:Tif4631p [Rhizophagus irregularis DAOM 197198w]
MDDDNFLPKLSHNLLEILNDEEYYDITIEVGNDPDVKIFRSHIIILYYRSPYLRRILSTNKKKNNGTLTHIKLPNILPEIFPIILRYIYGGRLSLKEYDTLDIINVMIAASELSLQELIVYLQSFLVKNKTNWMEQNFDFVYQTSFKNDSFLDLQKYCTDLITKEPDKIFKSPNFSLISEKLLITIIQSDNLQMSEIQIWEYLLKWGLAQNPELPTDFKKYSKDDFNTLKNTPQQCIPFIRFYNLSSKEFMDSVLPYKRILPKELYKDLLKTFLSLLDPDSKSSDKSRPRISSNQSQFNQMNEFEFFPLKTSEESIIASTKRNEIPTTSSIFGRAALGRTGSGSTLLLTSESSGHLDMVQRKVNALLNKLTLKNFESLSDQIIIYGNKSRGERDGRILREIIRLIFERSCNDSKFCAIYAYLCRKMMERVDPEIVDESIKNTDGKSVQGGTLFRKYLINHCQEDFEKGWKINIPSSSNESDLTSDKYYAAAKAKRKDSPKEEEMESLCILLNTVGKQLDHVKQKQIKKTKEKGMNSYFNRLEKISKLPSLSNRIKFMLMDIINLRKNDWNPQRNIDALINELTLGMIQL